MEYSKALEIVTSVCNNSNGNLQYHQQVQGALEVLRSASPALSSVVDAEEEE